MTDHVTPEEARRLVDEWDEATVRRVVLSLAAQVEDLLSQLERERKFETDDEAARRFHALWLDALAASQEKERQRCIAVVRGIADAQVDPVGHATCQEILDALDSTQTHGGSDE